MSKRFIQIGSLFIIGLVTFLGLTSGKLKLSNSPSMYKPLKVAIITDAESNHLKSLRLGEYYILQEWMKKTGGIIGYARITENSANNHIHRIEVKKNKSPSFLETKSDQNNIPNDLKNLYRQDSIQENEWENKLSQFLNGLLDLLDGEMSNPKKDLIGTINRSITFLCEEEVFSAYNKYLVVYSNWEDNVGNAFGGLPCDVTVLLINNSTTPSLGEKLDIDYLVFESFPSALNYIVEKEEHMFKSIAYVPF